MEKWCELTSISGGWEIILLNIRRTEVHNQMAKEMPCKNISECPLVFQHTRYYDSIWRLNSRIVRSPCRWDEILLIKDGNLYFLKEILNEPLIKMVKSYRIWKKDKPKGKFLYFHKIRKKNMAKVVMVMAAIRYAYHEKAEFLDDGDRFWWRSFPHNTHWYFLWVGKVCEELEKDHCKKESKKKILVCVCSLIQCQLLIWWRLDPRCVEL